MTTKTSPDPRLEADARRIVRVAALHDPLGAKGFRRTRARVEREAGARRGLFLAILGSFAACLGLVTTWSGPSGGADQPRNGVVAEIGAAAQPSSRTVKQTKPHVRTRSS